MWDVCIFEKRVVSVYMCNHWIQVSELFGYGIHRKCVCDCIIFEELLYLQLLYVLLLNVCHA